MRKMKMIRKKIIMLLLVQFLLSVGSLRAQEEDAGKVSPRMQLIESLGVGAKLMHAAPAAMAGFEELIVRDSQGLDHIFYFSTDGSGMAFSGALLDMQQKKNITQASYRAFVAAEIAKIIRKQQQYFIPYRADGESDATKPPLYLFLGPSCPTCLKLWKERLPELSKQYDIRLSYGGLRTLGVKQGRKAMWGWCLKGDKRSAVLRNEPLNIDVEANNCKLGVAAFNRMKETFGRYLLRVPTAYNQQGEVLLLYDSVKNGAKRK